MCKHAHSESEPMRVAWLQTVIPSYRLPFLKRLSQKQEAVITCFHGAGRKGFSVESVGRELPVKSVWVENTFWPFGEHRVAWQSVVPSIVKGQFHVIVVEEAVHNVSIWILWLLRKVVGFRFVLAGYGYRPQSKRTPLIVLRDAARMVLLRSADAVVVYTAKGKEACVTAGINPSKVFVNSNTLDTEMLIQLGCQVRQEDLEKLKNQYGLESHQVLLYMGRLIPQKRLDVLIEAMRELNHSDLNVKLLVVGDGHERQILEELAEDLPNIIFIGAVYDELELAKYFKISDLLVIPGRVGLACVHGFAYGVPVITSRQDVEQSPEFDYISHGENGIVVEKPDFTAYVKAIVRILQNEEILASLVAGASRTAQLLSMEQMVKEFISAVEYASRARL